MGQTLSEPITEKESAHCQNDEFAVSKINELINFCLPYLLYHSVPVNRFKISGI